MKPVEIPAPKILFDYQVADLHELAAHNFTGVVVAEMGAGKTLLAVESILHSDAETVLIIARPNTFEEEWRGTLLGQSQGRISARIISPNDPTAFADLQMAEPGVYLVSHEVFTRGRFTYTHPTTKEKSERGYDFSTINPDFVIVDEAHLLSNREAKGAKALWKLKALRRLVMSGTPGRNDFDNIWTLLRWVYPDNTEIAPQSYWAFVTRWCETEYDHFAVGQIKVVGELNPGELAATVPCWVQHFKRENCCEFHPQGFLDLEPPALVEHHLDLTFEQRRLIDQMNEEYVAWLERENEGKDGVKHPFVAKIPLAKRIRIRQMALGVPSIRSVLETVKDKQTGLTTKEYVDKLFFDEDCESPKLDLFERRLTEHNDTYLAVTSSKPFAEEVVRRLRAHGESAVLWTGNTSQIQRQAIKRDFRDGKVRTIVAVVSSISTGIDGLQFASHRMFLFDRDQDLTTMSQFFSRLDRRGQTQQVIIEEAIARGSYDQGIISSQLERQLKLAKSMNARARRLAREREAA